MEWTVEDAGHRLNELIALAASEGPQTINGHGATVLVTVEPKGQPSTEERPSFNDWLLNGPRINDEELELFERDRSPMREVDL